MVERYLNEIVNSISSGTTTNHTEKGLYAVHGSTGVIGYTDSPDYFGEKILVARVGANAGTTNIICGKYGVSDNTLIVEVNSAHEVKYVYYSLKYKNLNNLVFGSGQPLITGSLLKNILLYIPDKTSQNHIANILSDTDSMISSLEKLIAKKKAVKQGAMQELLTGKKRLQGFDGEWTHIAIGEMTETFSGGTPNTSVSEYWGGTIPWMNSGELNLKIVRAVEGRITEEGLKNSSTHFIPQFCVLIGLAGQGKTRGTAAYNTISLCTNQSIAAIYPNDQKFNSKFLYYIMDTQYEKLRELSSGDGGRGGLTKKLLQEYVVYIPKDVKEQNAIASILSDMDNEIEVLEQKLEKTRQIKQGMMQQLLTGKIRLI